MDCKKIRDWLDRYVDGELDSMARLLVEEHVAKCPTCAAELEGLRRVAEAADEALAGPRPTFGGCPGGYPLAPAGFDDAVMRAIRRTTEGRAPDEDRTAAAAAGVSQSVQWLRGIAASLRAKIQNAKPKTQNRRVWGLAGAGAFLALVAFTVYAAGIEFWIGRQQTILLGQPTLAWNSPASLRLVAYEDPDSKEPLRGAPVLLEARRKGGGSWRRLFAGRTNRAGTVDAHFRLAADLDGACLLRVRTGSFWSGDVLERPIAIERRARVLLATDKPIYQPGQTVHLRVLAMDTGAGRAAAGRAVSIEVKDPKGNRVFRKEGTTSNFGIASADFELAGEVNQGRYPITARVGDDETEKTVTVKPYVLPKFRVDAKADRSFYAPGEVVRGRVNAAYFFGKPVAAGRTKVALAAYDTTFHDFALLEGTTDANGVFSFQARLPTSFAGHPLARGDALVRLTAEVTDRAGHMERVVESVPVAEKPFRVGIVPESGEPAWGLENVFYIITSYPDGTPARTRGTVAAEDPRAGDPHKLVPRRAVEFTTDASGIGEVRLPVGMESLRLDLQARDEQGRKVREQRAFRAGAEQYSVWDSILLRTERAIYRVGQTVNVEALARSASGTLYLDVARGGQTVLTRSADLQGGRARFALDLSDDLVGTLTLNAYLLTPQIGMVRDSRVILVQPAQELQVAVEPSREVFRPGEEGQLRFRVTDSAGRPAPGAIGVSIVDESVFALREADVALEQDYFAMEKAILEPRYQAKFGLPEAFSPAAALRGVRGSDGPMQRRAAVALAALEGDLAGRGPGARFAQVRFLGQGETASGDTDSGVAGYGLAAESWPERQEWARSFRETAFNWLYWFFMAVCVIVPSRWVSKANPAFAVLWPLLFGGVILVTSLAASQSRTAWSEARIIAVLIGVGGLALGAAARRSSRARVAVPVLLCLGALACLAVALLFPLFATSREKAGRASTASTLSQFSLFDSFGRDNDARPNVRQLTPSAAIHAATDPHVEPPRLRQYFPETMLWQPEVITDDQGSAEIPLPVADSITDWRLSALACTADGRVGSVTRPVRVFQDFFVDIDLPATLTQNDEITLPVAVHNYLKAPQTVRLTLAPENWFEARGGLAQSLTIGANDVGVARFPITARRFGKHPLTFSAYGAQMSDAVKREIEVLPDGEEVVQTASDRLDGEISRVVTFPPDAIPGTQRLVLKIHPGVFSQVLEGLDGLLKVPYG